MSKCDTSARYFFYERRYYRTHQKESEKVVRPQNHYIQLKVSTL